MVVYSLGLFIIAGCAIVPSFIAKKKKLVTIICLIIPLFFMWVLCTFKGNNIGSDTPAYMDAYSKAYDTSSIKEARDIGYGLFQFVCARMHLPWIVFLGLCNAPVFIGTAIFAYKKTPYPAFMPFFIYTFLIFEFALSGLRQSIAIGCLLIGMAFFKNKKWRTWIIYFAMNAIAILMHKSSFIMIVFPFLSFLWLTKKSFLYISMCLLVGILFVSQIESYFFYGTSILEYYPNNRSTNYTFFFVFLLSAALAVAFLFFKKPLENINSKFDKVFGRSDFLSNHIADSNINATTSSLSFQTDYMMILPLLVFLIIGLYSNTSVRGYYYSVGSFGALFLYFIYSQKSKYFQFTLLVLFVILFSLYFILTFLRRSDCVPYNFFFQN